MAIALALAAGTLSEPATASPAPGKKHDKPAKPHEEAEEAEEPEAEEQKSEEAAARQTFNVSATGNWAHESRTQAYSALGRRDRARSHIVFGGTWVARSKVNATRTGKNAYRR